MSFDIGMLDRKLVGLCLLEARHHVLSNTWPCGIRSVDDKNDRERLSLKVRIDQVKAEVEVMRSTLAELESIEDSIPRKYTKKEQEEIDRRKVDGI